MAQKKLKIEHDRFGSQSSGVTASEEGDPDKRLSCDTLVLGGVIITPQNPGGGTPLSQEEIIDLMAAVIQSDNMTVTFDDGNDTIKINLPNDVTINNLFAQAIALGGTEQTITINGISYNIHFVIHDTGALDVAIGLHKHTDNVQAGSVIETARSRGTEGAETAVQSGDILGRFSFLGHDGTDYQRAAEIVAIADGTIGTGAMGTRLELRTSADGGNTPIVRVNVANDGTVTVPGLISAPAIIASGLTGATAASRYVGATVSGAPATGTFAKGDFIIDQTGKVYICTVAGSPGTWTAVSGGGGGGSSDYPINMQWPGTAAVNATLGTSHCEGTISDILLSIDDAPTGADLIIDLYGYGDANHPLSGGNPVSILTTKLIIPAGSKEMTQDSWAFVSGKDVFTRGGKVKAVITQRGSTIFGRVIALQLWVTP